MDDFAMPNYPDQSDLMHGLVDAELLNAKSLAYDAETSERTAYRIISGDTPLTIQQYRAIIRSNDKSGNRVIGDRLTRYALRGTERLAVDMSYGGVGDVHADAVTTLHKLADLLDARRAHEADGVITADEARAEVELYDECLHVLHRGRKACVEQPTTERKKAHALKIGGGA